MAASDELPAEQHRVIGNTPRDEVMARLIETTTDKLAEAGPPVRTLSVLGIAVKLEFNLNTIIAAITLISAISAFIYAAFNYVSLPAKNTAAIAQLRAEMGQPGTPDYLPASMRGVKHRMDRMEKDMLDSHADTVLRLTSIEAAIAVLRAEDSERFDRLDNRIDRLVETQGGSHALERRR